jgi:hypothetical protein
VVFVTQELLLAEATPPHYTNLTLVGGSVRLVVSLSQPPADGQLLTLFTYDSLNGDFSEIVVDATSGDSCVEWSADRIPSSNSYVVTLRENDICAAAAAAKLFIFLFP